MCPYALWKIEFEEFSAIKDVFLYLISVESAPDMKQLLPVNSYKDHVFSIVILENI